MCTLHSEHLAHDYHSERMVLVKIFHKRYGKNEYRTCSIVEEDDEEYPKSINIIEWCIDQLNDLISKLMGTRDERTKCFENIWNHQVFEYFKHTERLPGKEQGYNTSKGCGHWLKAELLKPPAQRHPSVEHDPAIMKIVRTKVAKTLQHADSGVTREFQDHVWEDPASSDE